MKSHGKIFEKEFKLSVEEQLKNFKIERIHDGVTWSGGSMIGAETPADFYALYKVKRTLHFIYIECKATSSGRLAFSALQDHQYRSLMDMDRFHKNAGAWVAINFYDPNNIRNLNTCFMVDINTWAEYAAGDKKSINMQECVDDERIIQCPRMRGSRFDMSTFSRVV